MLRRLRPILALFFLFAVQATAAGWRQCPHHDQLASQHAIPDAAHHDSHDSDTPAPEHSDGPCSCLSGAQCAVPVALHATSDVQVDVAELSTLHTEQALQHQAPARVPSLYLPEATAPPAAL